MAGLTGRTCDICIGCGKCTVTGTEASLQVVTESFLKNEVYKSTPTPDLRKDAAVTEQAMAEACFGIFFALADIGTTTIAMELYNADGEKLAEYVRPNPQRVFGADVISRILAAQNPLLVRQMQKLVKDVLLAGLQEFEKALSVTASPKASIDRMYIAGNTTMLYLLAGHDTTPLGEAPFRAEYLEKEEFLIGHMQTVLLPGISAFLGADVLAGVLACGMQEREEISLLIDLGTNGEMVLGNNRRLLAASTAAGPAFEGMLQADGQAVWGADVVKIAAGLLDEGVLDETGLLKEPYFTTGIRIGGVMLTQEHVRNLQTAKAAIAAGIQILAKEYGVRTEEIKHIYLAGGFGFFLEEETAIKVGLIPQEFRGRILAVGNSALAGCFTYHFDCAAEYKIKKIKETIQVLNLAEVKEFSEEFVGNMNFPQFS